MNNKKYNLIVRSITVFFLIYIISFLIFQFIPENIILNKFSFSLIMVVIVFYRAIFSFEKLNNSEFNKKIIINELDFFTEKILNKTIISITKQDVAFKNKFLISPFYIIPSYYKIIVEKNGFNIKIKQFYFYEKTIFLNLQTSNSVKSIKQKKEPDDKKASILVHQHDNDAILITNPTIKVLQDGKHKFYTENPASFSYSSQNLEEIRILVHKKNYQTYVKNFTVKQLNRVVEIPLKKSEIQENTQMKNHIVIIYEKGEETILIPEPKTRIIHNQQTKIFKENPFIFTYDSNIQQEIDFFVTKEGYHVYNQNLLPNEACTTIEIQLKKISTPETLMKRKQFFVIIVEKNKKTTLIDQPTIEITTLGISENYNENPIAVSAFEIDDDCKILIDKNGYLPIEKTFKVSDITQSILQFEMITEENSGNNIIPEIVTGEFIKSQIIFHPNNSKDYIIRNPIIEINHRNNITQYNTNPVTYSFEPQYINDTIELSFEKKRFEHIRTQIKLKTLEGKDNHFIGVRRKHNYYLETFKSTEERKFRNLTPFIKKGSGNTPSLNLDNYTGILKISGRSILENAKQFFTPIAEWLTCYYEDPHENTRIIFEIEGATTTSFKCILDFLKTSEKNKHKTDIEVEWYYESDDEDILELGEDYEEVIELPFNFIEIED